MVTLGSLVTFVFVDYGVDAADADDDDNDDDQSENDDQRMKLQWWSLFSLWSPTNSFFHIDWTLKNPTKKMLFLRGNI